MHVKTNQPVDCVEKVLPTSRPLHHKSHRAFSLAVTLVVVVAFALLVLPGWKQRGRRGYVSFLPSIARAAEINPWTLAVNKIREDRGEPTGKQAQVNIPQQVRHYSDSRRFLAIQVAEVHQHHLETPQDLVDLAGAIRRGEMVPLNSVTENYILFGVGGNADTAPFTRFENGSRIGLYNEAGLQKEYALLSESRLKLANSLASLKKELGALKKRDRSRRAALQSQIVAAEKSSKSLREDKELLDRNYGDAEQRAKLFGDYESLATLAKSFPDRNFSVEDPSERRAMKVRMLSSLRPEALSVLEEIAAAYREQFNRPLPITSLVRPDEYQLALSKTNANATRIETPPHSTGLAFDIYYRFMNADEQAHVMAHLARLKDEGRIEVLRENRDHYHVFAFVDGKRPDESVIAASLGTTSAKSAAKETSRERVVASSRRNADRSASKAHHSSRASSRARVANHAKKKGVSHLRTQTKSARSRKRR